MPPLPLLPPASGLPQLPQQYRKLKSNPTPEEIPLEEAIQLIVEKRAKDGPATARARVKKAASSGTKRPLPGFFRFCKDSREMRTAAAAAGGGAATSLSNETLSGRWKALPEEERQAFNAAASAALDQWKAGNFKAKNASNGSGGGGTSSSKDKGSGGSDNRIPQPKNAFFLFSSERRPGLKEELGGAVMAVEMMKKMAQEWRALEGSSVREEYARRAAVLRKAWVKENEEAAAALRGAHVWVGGGVGGGLKKKEEAAAAAEAVSNAAGAVPAGV